MIVNMRTSPSRRCFLLKAKSKRSKKLSSLLSNSIQEKVNVPHANANIMEVLALSYSREKPGSRKRVELLSCVAQQYTNKEIKQMFRFTNTQGEEVSCTDYELTKARLHSKMYGPGAALPKIRHQCSHKLPPETIAFVVELIHHPASEEYSSYKRAPCDGKQKSWISELLGGGNQPVL